MSKYDVLLELKIYLCRLLNFVYQIKFKCTKQKLLVFFYITNLKVKVFYITNYNVKNDSFCFVICVYTHVNLIQFIWLIKNFFAKLFLYISCVFWQCYQDNWCCIWKIISCTCTYIILWLKHNKSTIPNVDDFEIWHF